MKIGNIFSMYVDSQGLAATVVRLNVSNITLVKLLSVKFMSKYYCR